MSKFKLIIDKNYEELPNWCLFFIEVGRLLYKSKNINVVLSLPETDLISHFINVGIFDEYINQGKYLKTNIRDIILKSERGDIVILKQGNDIYEGSITQIEYLESQQQYYLMIDRGKQGKQGYLESKWEEKILSIRKSDHIKKGRKISKKIGVSQDPILNKIYTKENLEAISKNSNIICYQAMSKKKFEEFLNMKVFYNDLGEFSFEKFIYTSNVNTYKNTQLIPSNFHKNKMKIEENIPLICTNIDINTTLLDLYNNKVLLINRNESANYLNDTFTRLNNYFRESNVTFINEKILAAFSKKNIEIPPGVELTVWR